MAINVGELQYTLEVIDKNTSKTLKSFNTGVDSAGKKADSFGARVSGAANKLAGFGTSLKNSGKQLTLFASVPLAAAGVGLVKLASDAEETENKFNVVFKGMTEEANAFAESFGNDVGRATSDIQRFTGGIGDILKPLGFATDEALGLSQEITKLALDVASFNNVSDDQVIKSFTSALTGERESLKTLGIVISEADIQQEALTAGLVEQGEELTKTAKAQATYNLLLANTEDAQGDLLRTQDSFANQLKATQAQFKEVSEELGARLIPVATKVLEVFNSLIEGFGNLPDGVQTAILVVGGLVAVLGPLLVVIGSILSVLPALGAALTVATGPVGLVIAAVAALVAGIVLLVKNWETVTDFLRTNFPVAFGAAEKVVESLKVAFDVIVEAFKVVGKAAVTLFKFIKDNFNKIANVLVILFPPIGLLIKAVQFLAKNWREVLNVMKRALDLFVGAVIKTWDVIINVFTTSVKIVTDIVDGVVRFFTESVPRAIQSGKEFAEGLLTGLFGLPEKFFSFAGDTIDGFIDGIKAKFTDALNAMNEFGASIIGSVKGILGIASPSKIFKELGGFTIEGFVQGLEEESPEAIDAMGALTDGIAAEASELPEKLDFTGTFQELSAAADDAFQEASDAVQEFADANAAAQQEIQADIKATEDEIASLTESFNEAAAEAEKAFSDEATQIVLQARQDQAALEKEIAEEQKKATEEALKAASELEKANNKLLELKQQQRALESEGGGENLGAQVAEQEAKVRSLEEESGETGRLIALKQELAEVESLLATQKEQGVVSAEQLEEAERVAALNPLEALLERFEAEKLAREEQFNAELEELEVRKEALTTSLQERQEEFQNFFSNVIAEDQQFTQVYTQQLQQREAVTVASIQRLITFYRQLAAAKRAAGRHAGGFHDGGLTSLPGFSQGGMTAKGHEWSPAGIVHRGEWVAPKWMVESLPSMFKDLEGIRTNGAGQVTNDNQKIVNVNVNNNGAAESDFWRNSAYLRFMGRYL